jgi:Na+/melibiose symporter-like transporter
MVAMNLLARSAFSHLSANSRKRLQRFRSVFSAVGFLLASVLFLPGMTCGFLPSPTLNEQAVLSVYRRVIWPVIIGILIIFFDSKFLSNRLRVVTTLAGYLSSR